ncbi:MAG: hypothetical protein PHT69_13830 [Bacteroidales bacterium]|nr:hypothetical protein [Bacteroidales bacterium]
MSGSLLFHYFSLSMKVRFKNKKLTNEFLSGLELVLKTKEITLTHHQKERIRFYCLLSFLTNTWFSDLRGYKPSSEEVQSALYSGALSYFVDELYDTNDYISEALINALKSKNSENSSKHRQLLVPAQYCFEKVLNQANADFLDTAFEVLEAQDLSRRQKESQYLDLDELRSITFEKGAKSVFLFRLILKNQPIAGEKEFVFTLGYLMQLVDDIFDIHKDYNEKIQTLFTNAKDVKELNRDFNLTLTLLIKQLKRLNYKSGNKTVCFIKITTVLARAMLCFDKLLQIQKEQKDEFNITVLSSKDLNFIDYQSMSNIFRTIKNGLKLMTLWNNCT